MKWFKVIILLILSTSTLYGQSWVESYKETITHRENEELSKAYLSAKECLSSYLSEDGSISENYAGILYLLSTLCYDSSIYSEGVQYAEKEVAIREQLNNDEKVSLGNAYYNLGALYNANFQFEKAGESFKKALDIYTTYFEPAHTDIIVTYWKLGTVSMNQKKFSEAYDFFQKGFENYNTDEITMDFLAASYDMGKTAMAIEKNDEASQYFSMLNEFYTSSGYESSVENLYVLFHLGECNQALNNYTVAIQYYDDLLAHTKGMDMGTLEGQALKNKAFCLQAMGKTAEASSIYSENIGEEPLAINNAATLEYANGNFEKAEELYLKALNILSEDTTFHEKDFFEITNNLSGFYITTGKIEDAEKILSEAFKKVEGSDVEEKYLFASLLIKQGQVEHKKQDFISSDKYLGQAEEILKNENQNSKAYIALLNNRAALYHEQGIYTEAQRILEEAIEKIAQDDANSEDLAGLYFNVAAIHQEQGNYNSASNYLNNAGQLLQGKNSSSSRQLYGNILRQQASLNIQLGIYDVAEKNLNEAKEVILKTVQNGSQLIIINLEMARLHQAKGEYSQAEKAFIESLQQLELKGKDNTEYLSAQNSLGVLYQVMGNYKEALKRFNISKSGFQKIYGTYHPGYATAIENISSTYQLLGEMDKVEPLLKEAIQSDKVIYGDMNPKYAVSLHNLATLYQKQQKFDEAIPLFNEALTIYKNSYGKNHPSYAATLHNLAVVNHESGRYEEAEKFFLEVLDIRKEILGENHPEYSFTLYGLAALYHNKEEYLKAKPLYQQAVEQYLYQIREYFPSLSEKEKSAFYNKVKPVFASFADFSISYYLSSGDSEILKDLYNVQLSTKAILLNAANKVRDRILSSNDTILINKFKEWTQLKEQVVKHIAMTAGEQEESNFSLHDLEIKINSLEKELSEQSSLFASTFEQQVVNWQEVRNTLKDKEAAIEIIRVNKKFTTDSIYYASLILKSGAMAPIAVILPEGVRLEKRFYNYYRNAIKFSEPDVISYENYWMPIQRNLQDVEKVFISSDGIYNKISLATLFDADSDRFILDELDIRLVSNTRELAEVASQNEVKSLSAIVFGSPDFNLGTDYTESQANKELTRMMGFQNDGIPPLPGTKQEAINLKEILEKNNWTSTIFIDQEATEENFKRIENPFLLHVATHGYFLSDLEGVNENMGLHLNNPEANPLFRSGLLLTGAAKGLEGAASSDQEDGVLTAYEAMNLNLDDTEIVILSACETGLGEIKNGEGVYGLQRSFIVAGANSVLMSLWKVNDETTMELMTNFYTHLLSGKDKFSAFKEAQLQIRVKYDDPYHWGAFIILGK